MLLISLSLSFTTTDSEAVVCHLPAAKAETSSGSQHGGARGRYAGLEGQGPATARGDRDLGDGSGVGRAGSRPPARSILPSGAQSGR